MSFNPILEVEKGKFINRKSDTVKTIKDLMYTCWLIADEHGFHDKRDDKTRDGAMISAALITSEIGELIEEIRRERIDNNAIGDELSDIVIRVLDFAQAGGVPFAESLAQKILKNIDRPYLHGKAL